MIKIAKIYKTTHLSPLPTYQGAEGDMHVRPLPGNPDKWLCEICALRAPEGGKSLKWRTDAPKVGSLFCGPEGLGGVQLSSFAMKQRWIASAQARLAPHCKGCMDSMAAGTMPWPKHSPKEPNGVEAKSGQDVKPVMETQHLSFISSSAPAMTSITMGPVQKVCYCCQVMVSVSDG